MSRIWVGLALVIVAGTCHAQRGFTDVPPFENVGTIGNDTQSEVVDPRAVEIPLNKGSLIKDVLDALNKKGFRIKYKPELVPETMTVVERPKQTRVDYMLNEILEPWDLRVRRGASGEMFVGALKKKKKKAE
jgi:hypothetical protein